MNLVSNTTYMTRKQETRANNGFGGDWSRVSRGLVLGVGTHWLNQVASAPASLGSIEVSCLQFVPQPVSPPPYADAD
jgi:hypothetical protein